MATSQTSNPFDQFDSVDSTAPSASSNLVSAPNTGANPFDQFDSAGIDAAQNDEAESTGTFDQVTHVAGNMGRAASTALPVFNQAFYGGAEAALGTLHELVGKPLVEAGVLPQSPFGVGADYMQSLRQGQKVLADNWGPKDTENDGNLAKGLYSGAQSMALALPALGAGVATGNPGTTLAIMSGVTGGQAYGDARDKNLSVPESALYGADQAGIEYLTEKLPVGMLFKDLKASAPFLKTVFHQMATEIPGEQVATAAQDFVEWAMLNPEKPFQTYLDARPDAAAQTLVATMFQTGLQTGVMHLATGGAKKEDPVEAMKSAAEDGLQGGLSADEAVKPEGLGPRTAPRRERRTVEGELVSPNNLATADFYVNSEGSAASPDTLAAQQDMLNQANAGSNNLLSAPEQAAGALPAPQYGPFDFASDSQGVTGTADQMNAMQAQTIQPDMPSNLLLGTTNPVSQGQIIDMQAAPKQPVSSNLQAVPIEQGTPGTPVQPEAIQAPKMPEASAPAPASKNSPAVDQTVQAKPKAGIETKTVKQPVNRKKINIHKDSILTAVAKYGGISQQYKQDTTGETGKRGNKLIPGIGQVFMQSGTGLDDMATKLDQDGYIPKAEMQKDGGVSWLQEAIRAEMSGSKKHWAAGSDKHEEALLEKLDAEYQAHLDNIHSQRDQEYSDYQAQKQKELDDINFEIDHYDGWEQEQAAAFQRLFGSDAESQTGEVEAGSSGGSANANDESQTGQGGKQAETSGAAPQKSPEFGLETQTEKDLADKAKAEQDAKEKADKENKANEEKAAADKERDQFTLTGSNRPSDANPNQNDMFSSGRKDDYHSEPSAAQKQIGNYPKEKLKFHGLDLSIENQAGTMRTGKDEGGKPWEVRLAYDYGYIRGTEGADGDHVDVYYGPNKTSEKVFVVNQLNSKGGFDEHKVMLGFNNADQAEKGYLDNYETGWDRYEKPLVEMNVDQFKNWLNNSDTTKPAKLTELKQTNENATTKPAEKIDDVGEKMGRARKDMSTDNGPRRNKPEPENKGWRSRYDVHEIVKSSKKEQEGKWALVDKRKKDFYGQNKQIGVFDSKEEAQAAMPLAEVARNHRAMPRKEGEQTKWAIYRIVSDRKRVQVVPETFDNQLDAARYMAKNAEEIITTRTSFGEEILPLPETVRREGEQIRFGNVDANGFRETFGFRAVEFGNWNNQEERQQVMNYAYDSLIDLAKLLNIPPRAISLNGEIGLAFGARGQGLSGAKAHYERDYAAINLTKMSGAGSLAHEWFHAFDHYLGRLDGKAERERKLNERGDLAYKTDGPGDYASHGFKVRSDMREELRQAYKNLIVGMFKKAEKYVEDANRADKFLGNARDDLEAALNNFRSDINKDLDPKYYKRHNKKATAEQLQKFEEIADKLLRGESLALRLENTSKGALKKTSDDLEILSDIYKKVRGRTGFDSQHYRGIVDKIGHAMRSYESRLEFLNSAENKEEKSRNVTTQYAMDAREIDYGRASDYWATEHEMAARAFAAYIDDKLRVQKNLNDFLTYGTREAVFTPWGWKNAYPKGEERKAINGLFDKFFTELKHKETENGNVVLYSRSGSVTGGKGAPLTREEVQGVVDDFFNRYPGGKPTHVRIVTDDQTLPEGVRRDVRTLGYYAVGKNAEGPRDGIVLIAPRLRSEADVIKTLQHEILVHKGLGFIEPTQRREIIDAIIAVGHETPSLKSDWAEIQDLYSDKSKQEQAEELIARIAEKKINFFSRAWNDFFLKIRPYLEKFGLAKPGINRAALLDVIHRIGDAFAEGRQARIRDDIGSMQARSAEPGGRAMSDEEIELQLGKDWRKKGEKKAQQAKEKLSEPAEGPEPIEGNKSYEEIKKFILADADRSHGMIRGIIERTKEILAMDMRREWIRFRQNFLNSFESIAWAEKDSNGGKLLDATVSPTKMAEFTRNTDQVLYVMMHKGVPTLDKDGSVVMKEGSKGWLQIFKPLGEKGLLQDWELWAAAQRAKRLKAEGKENLFQDDHFDTIDQEVERNGHLELFKSVQKEWAAYNRSMLDFAEEAGLINPESRAEWENDDYVPFHRVNELAGNDKPKGQRNKRGLSGQKSGIKKLSGGVERIMPLDAMVRNMAHLVDASFKNMAMQRIVEQFNGTDVMSRAHGWGDINDDVVRDRLATIDINLDTLTPKQKVMWRQMVGQQMTKGTDIVSVRIGGKPQYFRVEDPLVLDAIQNLGPERMSNILKILSWPKRMLTKSVTADPAFMLRNFIRDTIASWQSLENAPALPTTQIYRALKNVMAEGENSEKRLAIAIGGGGGGFHDTSRQDVRQYLEDLDAWYKHPFRNAWNRWERLGARFENANRLAIYDSVIAAGGTHAEAVYQAMDLLNFSRRGSNQALQWVLHLSPFLNARMQGLDRLGRGGVNRPITFMLKGSMISLFTLALLAVNKDKEEWDKLKEFDRDNYWHIWINGEHIRIPKPFEVGLFFGTAIERAYDYGKTGDSERAWEAIVRGVKTTLAIDHLQFYRPGYEVAINENPLTSRPIINTQLQGVEPTAQYDEMTSEVAKRVAQSLPESFPDWMRSPIKLQYLIRGYMGTLSTYVMQVSDMALSENRPAMRKQDIPVVGSFYRDGVESSRYVDEFYKLENEVSTAVRTLKKFKGENDSEAVMDFKMERAEELRLKTYISGVKKQITELNADMNSIKKAPYMPPEVKRAKLDKLIEQRNKLAEQAVMRMEYATSR